jgi:hypothetical protein
MRAEKGAFDSALAAQVSAAYASIDAEGTVELAAELRRSEEQLSARREHIRLEHAALRTEKLSQYGALDVQVGA